MPDATTTRTGGLRLSYNSPVILTFSLLCTAILLIDTVVPSFINSFFTVPPRGSGFRFFSLNVYKLVSHAAGHANWRHLVGNFSFILLIGPILEEKYGSGKLVLMMLLTALVTGILNVLFFSYGLLGASGIVFMLILLISFTNIRSGQIPLTFILVVLLFLGREIFNALFDPNNNISEFAHLIGGLCGGLFGFLLAGKKVEPTAEPKSDSGV